MAELLEIASMKGVAMAAAAPADAPAGEAVPPEGVAADEAVPPPDADVDAEPPVEEEPENDDDVAAEALNAVEDEA